MNGCLSSTELRNLLHGVKSSRHGSSSPSIQQKVKKITKKKKERTIRPHSAFVQRKEEEKEQAENDETDLQRATRDFLSRPNPHKMLLVNERKTELYNQLVMKDRQVKSLERKIKDLYGGGNPYMNHSGLGNPETETVQESKADVIIRLQTLFSRLAILVEKQRKTSDNGQVEFLKKQIINIAEGAQHTIKLLREETNKRSNLQQQQQQSSYVKQLENRVETVSEKLKFCDHKIQELNRTLDEKDKTIMSQQRRIEELETRHGQIRDAISLESISTKEKKSQQTLMDETAFRLGYRSISKQYSETHKELLQTREDLRLSKEENKQLMERFEKLKGKMEKYHNDQLSKALQLGGGKLKNRGRRRSTSMGEILIRTKNPDGKENEKEKEKEKEEEEEEIPGGERKGKEDREDKQQEEKAVEQQRNLHSLTEFDKIVFNSIVEEQQHASNKSTIEKDMERTKQQFYQMRFLVEAMKNLYLKEENSIEKLQIKTAAASSQMEVPTTFVVSGEELIRCVQNHGSKCCCCENVTLYIYEDEDESLWTKRRESNFVNKVSIHKDISGIDKSSLSEVDVALFAFQNQAPVHIERGKKNRGTKIKHNILAIPILGEPDYWDNRKTRKTLGVLLASNKNLVKTAGKDESEIMAAAENKKKGPTVWSTTNYFTEYDESLLTILGDHIGRIMVNTMRERKKETDRRVDLTMREIPKKLYFNHMDVKNSFEKYALSISEIAKSLLFARYAKVFLVEFNNATSTKVKTYWTPSTANNDISKVVYNLNVGQSIASKCILENKPLIYANAYAEPSFNANIDLSFGKTPRKSGPMICIPIHVDSTLIEKSYFKKSLGRETAMGCIQLLFTPAKTKEGMDTNLKKAAKAVSELMTFVGMQIDTIHQFH